MARKSAFEHTKGFHATVPIFFALSNQFTARRPRLPTTTVRPPGQDFGFSGWASPGPVRQASLERGGVLLGPSIERNRFTAKD
jgi:hypothetical protein